MVEQEGQRVGGKAVHLETPPRWKLMTLNTQTRTPLGPQNRGLSATTASALPVGNSPADRHGQGGLRWGLLQQLLELQ